MFESQVKSKFAWLQSREELKESDQSKCVNQQQPITGARLETRRAPIRPVPRHGKRTQFSVAKTQGLYAGHRPNLQNDEPLTSQRVERMNNFGRTQRLIGP